MHIPSKSEIRTWLRNSLQYLLRYLAKLTIWRFRPGIIGVTGSVGKTSAKLAIAAVLSSERHVRTARGNLNNEFGLPLTILGDWPEAELRLVSREAPPATPRWLKGCFWLKVIASALFNLLFTPRRAYPQIIVLEYGADRPGDLKYLLSIARPTVGAITAIGDTPVHVEFYNSPEEVAREKSRLIDQLPASGFAILNADDPVVMGLKDRTRARLITYGFSAEAQVRIVSFENKIEGGVPIGVVCKLEYGGSTVPVRIEHVFGKPHVYAAAAAAAAGLAYGLNLVQVSEALRAYRPAPERMQVLPGIRNSLILDDAYNASPLSMLSALDTLETLPGGRKIAILGDMRELGQFSEEAHRRIGTRAGGFADIIVAVGDSSHIVIAAAKGTKAKPKNLYEYKAAEEAVPVVAELIQPGDVVLVKGSHAVALDQVAHALKEREEDNP